MRSGKSVLNALSIGTLALGLASCGESPPPAASPAPPAPSPATAAAPAVKPAPAAPAESSLARRVREALASDPSLVGLALDVREADGVITLFGTADTSARRRKAEQVAAAVSGVKSVKNELMIVAGS